VQAGAVTGSSSRVPLLLVAVWLGGLLAATSVGLLAVRLVAAQVGDPAVAPLSAVAAASTAATPSSRPSPAPPPDAPPPATPTAGPAQRPAATATRTFSTAAGTLGVQCTGTALRLLYATPAEGFALDEREVSGTDAEVRFEDEGTKVRVRVSCATGAPQLVEQRTERDGDGEDDG
jgi:hypothetical protein